MKRKIVIVFVLTLMFAMVIPATGIVNILNQHTRDELEYGDAPEGDNKIAYPSLGVTGAFPTCINSGPAGYVSHNNFGAWFGPAFDFELEGNGGSCPNCFPPYDQDECFQDGDAGLIKPEPFTIDAALNVVPCPNSAGTPLQIINQQVVWGTDLDIQVHNTMPGHEPYLDAFVNLIIDWNQNGKWGDPGEHVLINFIVPALYIGPLSALVPPNFNAGPNPGYVWARFTISEKPVVTDWTGEEYFEDGESEDYLLELLDDIPPIPDLDCRGIISWSYPGGSQQGGTKTGTFDVGNIGQAGSLLDWSVTSWPTWGAWTFTPSSGTGVGQGVWVTVTASVVPPNQPNQHLTGYITVTNSADSTDYCQIPVSLDTPRARLISSLFLQFLEHYPSMFPLLRALLGL